MLTELSRQIFRKSKLKWENERPGYCKKESVSYLDNILNLVLHYVLSASETIDESEVYTESKKESYELLNKYLSFSLMYILEFYGAMGIDVDESIKSVMEETYGNESDL